MAAGARGITLLIWMIVFTVICAVFLLLRLWAARITRRKFFADDAMVIFAFANTIALEGVCVWAITHGLGKHTNELTMDDFGVQFKLIVASGVTWLLGTVFVKLSVLWLYTRIFSTPQFKRWAYGLMGIVSCYGIAFVVLFMTNCHPISQHWDPQPDGWCRDLTIDELASVSLNIAIDVAIVLLPLPPLWGLQMALRNKIVISVMFSIGFLTIGIMCWRLQATITSASNPDFVYSLANIGLLSLLELWLGVIVACIPTLAPLLRAYVKPVVTKLSYANTSDRQMKMQNVNATIGGSTPNGTGRPRKIYSELGDDNSSYGDLDEEHLTGGVVAVTTECKYAPRSEASVSRDGHHKNSPGIYVQQAIRTQDSWQGR